jgi:hypothetical protein
MAKHANRVDPLMDVIVEAPGTQPHDEAQPEASVMPQTAPVDAPPPAPASIPKSYRVVETVAKISIGGQITSLPAGQVLSDLGYDITKLQAMGVKLELVEG